MQRFSTNTWGYNIPSPEKINFYHVLLEKISLKAICENLDHVREISKKSDGSITLTLESAQFSTQIVQDIAGFFEKIEKNFLDCPNYAYQLDSNVKQILRQWGLAFEGCLAILLTNDKELKGKISENWKYINSKAGGLSFGQYTLIFYKQHAKILHPIFSHNYDFRNCFEQKTSRYMQKIGKRMLEAQPGFEGVAMLSFVEEEIKLTSKEIVKMIFEKSYNIASPVYAAFLDEE